MFSPTARDQINKNHQPYLALVKEIKGHLALIMPINPETAPQAIQQGVWVQARDYKVDMWGTLQYFMSASRGQWHFTDSL